MAHDVFISHAHKDRSSAEGICQRLESSGVRCWMAPRDIAFGEDWMKTVQSAIGSSRVMVLVFSDSANLSPHIVREIANAFYTGRKIIVFRLTNSLPRRDLLFYLGEACWFEAINGSSERSLQGLTVQIKDVLDGLRTSGELLSPRGAVQRMAASRLSDGWSGEVGSSAERYPRILKSVGIAASVAGAGWLCWTALQQTNQDGSSPEGNLQSTDHRSGIAPAGEKEKMVISSPHYTFTRLGMWVAENSSPTQAIRPSSEPTPFPMQDDQLAKVIPLPPENIDPNEKGEEKSLASTDPSMVKIGSSRLARENYLERLRMRLRSKSHHRRAMAENLKSRGIKGWLTSLWRQSIKGIKGTPSR